MGRILTAIFMLAASIAGAAPASADDSNPISGCESVPIFGLNPQIRKICDRPIQPDGSWERLRQFVNPQYVHSSCGGVYYPGGNCPPWMQNDTIPAGFGEIVTYFLTPETVPPGEPGHLDNPIRCSDTSLRCS